MFLISDNGKNFSHLAREFNCHYEHATENVSVKGPNWKWCFRPRNCIQADMSMNGANSKYRSKSPI